MKHVLFTIVLALILAAPAFASERHPTLAELEGEVMCPVCDTTLDQSDSPAARQIERAIGRMIRAGYTRSEIKRELVAQYGPSILAAPQKHGFGLLAWVLPLAGIVVGAAALGFGAWRWSRAREQAPIAGQLEPELESRVDTALEQFE